MKTVCRALVSIVLVADAYAGETRFTFERGLMGTRFLIICHGEDKARAKTAAEKAFLKGEEINAAASDYIPDGELLGLSKAPVGQPTAVSPVLFEILTIARATAEKTDGRFDPTIGPLTRLWRETRRTGKLPDAETLAAARAACDWRSLTLDPTTRSVALEKPGMRLDLGGIAKGYAADRMFEIMRQAGFPRTCVVAGGDLRLGDPPPGKTGWNVGMKALEKDELAGDLLLSNCGVSTSGDLHQVVVIGDTRYSHIIDPATGLGLTTHFAVTIVAPDATTSDSLDNASCVAGPDQAEQLARKWGALDVRVTK